MIDLDLIAGPQSVLWPVFSFGPTIYSTPAAMLTVHHWHFARPRHLLAH